MGVLFFCVVVGDFTAGFFHNLIDVLLDKALELSIAIDGSLNRRDLLARDIAGDVFAILAKLVVIKRACGALAKDRELTPFEAGDAGGLLEKNLRVRFRFHPISICIYIYLSRKKKGTSNE